MNIPPLTEELGKRYCNPIFGIAAEETIFVDCEYNSLKTYFFTPKTTKYIPI